MVDFIHSCLESPSTDFTVDAIKRFLSNAHSDSNRLLQVKWVSHVQMRSSHWNCSHPKH